MRCTWLVLLVGGASAFHPVHVLRGVRFPSARAATLRMDFGDSFYQGFDKWAAEYPEEDKINYPEYFVLPKGIYEVALPKPLGIAFEEIEVGKGVKVVDLVEGGNAAKSGVIAPGHVLLAVTAIKHGFSRHPAHLSNELGGMDILLQEQGCACFHLRNERQPEWSICAVIGAKYERRLIPARELNFDTVIDAIGSNEPRWGCKDVILQFASQQADPNEVGEYLERIELPADSPWRGMA